MLMLNAAELIISFFVTENVVQFILNKVKKIYLYSRRRVSQSTFSHYGAYHISGPAAAKPEVGGP